MPEIVQKARVLLRARTAAEWATLNEILRNKELGIESDTGKDKLGDGVTPWNALAYRATGGGGATNLSVANRTATTLTVASDSGTDAVIPAASGTEAGLITAASQAKLDGIADGAEVYVNADWNATSGDAAVLNKPPLGTAAAQDASAFATAAQGTDDREWSASTVSQAEAEGGTATTRRAFTAERVRQAIVAWWSGSAFATKLAGIADGATANATDAALRDRATHTGTQAAGTISGLATVATSGAYNDLSGRPPLGTAAATAATDYAPAAQGVTGGNSHDHSGGDGAQIAYSSLSGLPTLGSLAAQSGTFSGNSSGTNTGDQTISNSSDATSHTVTLSASGGTVQLVGGANITLTTTGTSSAGIVTIAATGHGGGGGGGGGSLTIQDEGSNLSTSVSTINFTGAGVTATGTSTVTVDIPGGGGNSFTTIAVAGQSDVVADSSTDTLTLAAGAGMAITTNATTDTVTLRATGPSRGQVLAAIYSMATP